MTLDPAELRALIEPVARRLLGEPNRKVSTKTVLRFGARGSLSIDLAKGTFYDHEIGEGGGVLDLIQRETGRTGASRFEWLIEEGFLPGREAKPERARIVKAYPYHDESGELLFEVVRFEPKDFRQRRPDGTRPDGWNWSTRGVRPVPYRLPELSEALGLGKAVYIVEGEKDADRLWALGVPATTNAGGAGKWRHELTEFFAGAEVVVIPDRDPQKTHPKTGEPMFHPDGRPILPGQDHGEAIAHALSAVARVKLLDLSVDWPEMPLKGDVSNWLDAGGTASALYELAERQPVWSPQPPEQKGPQAGWRNPDPLPDGLLPVAPFDMAFLPEAIRAWVADCADLKQCPPEFVAIPAMVALAATIGRKISIRPQRNTDWSEVANLWGMIVGPSGEMKTPAMNDAIKPLRRLEMEARKSNEVALKAFAFDAENHKLRVEAGQKRFKDLLKKDPDAEPPSPLVEPFEPKARRYIVDDATYEKLGDILVNNANGVLAFRDELMSLLRPLDREENAAARGFFLTAWGGKEGYTFDRIIRGTQHIEAACLSLLGGTQPGRIADFVERSIDGGQGDDGMLQRFGLAVWPDSGAWREVDRYADGLARQSAFAVFQRLNALDPYAVGAVQDQYDPIPHLKFDSEAQEVFSTWHRHLETCVLRGDDNLSTALKGHFSKYRKLVPALALINHLVDDRDDCGDIGKGAIERAIDFSRYLETHARRIYASGAQNEAAAAKAILTHVKRGDLREGFTAREVHQRGWSNLSSIDRVKAALDLLVDLGWLADKVVKRLEGGRPTVTYLINPRG
jgi:Protein of unknown function (DUF3987)